MYNLLIKIVILAALVQLGMTLTELETCHSKKCLQKVERRSRDVLRIKWKAISVFPEEAKRFR